MDDNFHDNCNVRGVHAARSLGDTPSEKKRNEKGNVGPLRDRTGQITK